MADSNRTGQRLLDSIRKAKAGDDAAGSATSPPEAAVKTQPPAAPAGRKTATRKAPARAATAKKTAPRQPTLSGASATKPAAPGDTTSAPGPKFATERPQPAAQSGTSSDKHVYSSRGRIWPD
jgi:hypothetical protein